MKLTRHLHRQIELKNRVATLGFLGIIAALAWLSTLYPFQSDWTDEKANTLSPATEKVLQMLPGKVEITAYIKSGIPIRLQIAHLIDRYSRLKPDLTLDFVDPNTVPEKARALGVGEEGLVIVEYRGRIEKLTFIDEATLTNALLQLSHADDRWIGFLTGHGERSPEGEANFDLKAFTQELSRRKINAVTVDLAKLQAIPDNTMVLVIASPKVALLPGEIDIVKRYVQGGGNLFVLTDPGTQTSDFLWQLLGVRPLPGQIVDKAASLAGIDDPTFVIVSEYLQHPVTRNFQTLTVFPGAIGFALGDDRVFESAPLLASGAESWSETAALTGTLRYESGSADQRGPITLAYALTRNLGDRGEQRLIVVGDGDFLANSYIANAGNLDMGLRMMNWLIHDDRFIDIPARTAPDRTLRLSAAGVTIIGFGFLIVLPVILLASGLLIWRQRRRH